MPPLQVGDKFPDGVQFEWVPITDPDPTSCGLPQTFDASKEFKGKKVVIVSVPGAFTPGCQANHIPPILANLETFIQKGVDLVAVIGFNDAWVMSAWGKVNGVKGDSKILFLSDTKSFFSKNHGWDAGMGERNGRWAMIVDKDGTVTYAANEDSPIPISPVSIIISMESDLDSSTVRAAQECAAKLPDHLRNRTYFNLVPYRIILSVPFALDDATNNRLAYYMPSSASESAGARPTFSSNTTPSGELLANVAQQLDMLTGNALLDWGLLSGLLRAVGRRLRSENWMGHAPAWYDWDQQLQVVKEADALVRAGQDARGTIHLPNAARYRLPLSSLYPPAGVGLAVERDCVPGSYAPVPPYMQQEALRALGGSELPGTIGGLLQALRKMDRSAFAIGI